MTIERFKEILRQEGLPEENIESIIENKPDSLDWNTLDEDAARGAAIMTKEKFFPEEGDLIGREPREFTYEEFSSILKEYNFTDKQAQIIWDSRPVKVMSEWALRKTCEIIAPIKDQLKQA